MTDTPQEPLVPELPVPAADDPQQPWLFDAPPDWKATWSGMPDFNQRDLTPWQSVKVHFRNRADQDAFARLIKQTVTDSTQSVWYPKAEIGHYVDKRYATAERVNPRYPVYIISKGRWETRLTADSLEKLGVPYQIVIEPQERDAYAAVIDPAKIRVLPFSNLGQGSIPARNWVWEDAIARGAARHWILDDNIDGFFRLHQNLKISAETGSIFKAAEDFADRYENMALASFNYHFFAKRKQLIPPFVLNTRCYSCILIKNDLEFRWRGRYNEDTDLSLRVLKAGLCTVQFNAFLACKMQTMTMKGGNTDELYAGEGRLKMAQSLQEQHPELVKITKKWGRWQHQVDYRPFKDNRLVLKPDALIQKGEDPYGMEIRTINP